MAEEVEEKMTTNNDDDEVDEEFITLLDVIKLEHDYLLERNEQLEHSNWLFICTIVFITLCNVIAIFMKIFIPT